jgi:DNA repair protein RadA/Sms
MARDGAIYTCQSCGTVHTKWAGQCTGCAQWNVLVEEVSARPPGALAASKPTRSRGLAFETLDADTPTPLRISTGVAEFDRVCGGGVVPGSAILLSGDPGVGKSTLLLQVAAQAALRGASCAYISGEEAIEQVRARAQRMGLAAAPVRLAAETSLREIVDGLKKEPFDLVVIDSIQTMWSDALEAGPGSVSQVRAAAGELVRLAKKRNIAVVLVGHVTKDGQIAGPRVVEHMVDAVLAFEGERGYPFRILRAAKNRFGRTDEIGVFEMGDGGPPGSAQSPPPCSSTRAASARRARRSSPASRARARCWWSSRPWWPPPPTGRRAARSWAGTAAAWPWCWPCWRRAAALASATVTST